MLARNLGVRSSTHKNLKQPRQTTIHADTPNHDATICKPVQRYSVAQIPTGKAHVPYNALSLVDVRLTAYNTNPNNNTLT